ncbi:hypothetical protein SOPP22_16520 [Shewanella sp. OPT22]|nr:hypothetical protein SOPP22_16520 [Shewanella sp. OPT22]
MKKITLFLSAFLLCSCQNIPPIHLNDFHLINKVNDDKICTLSAVDKSNQYFSCTIYKVDPINHNFLKLDISNIYPVNPQDKPLFCKFKNYRPLRAEPTFAQNYSIDAIENHRFTINYKRPIRTPQVYMKFEASGLHIKSHITVSCRVNEN